VIVKPGKPGFLFGIAKNKEERGKKKCKGEITVNTVLKGF
jgi:hypothetical protein